MKKLSSCLLVLTLSLNQFGSTCSAAEISKKQERIEKNVNYFQALDKDSNKSKKENKKHSKETNINVDLTIPAIALGATILGAVGIHQYAKSRKPNIFKQFYSASGAAIENVFDSGKKWTIKNYPLAKDWTSEKYNELKVWSAENYPVFKSWLNSTYYDTKDWTSEKYDEAKIWFDQADTSKKVGAIAAVSSLSIVTLVGMFMCCCRGAKVPPVAPAAQAAQGN